MTSQQNNKNATNELMPERMSQIGEKTSHNNSTDDGTAAANQFFPGTNGIVQQFSEQRSQQVSRGSKRAHHKNVGRRSQTTHEQSHGDQPLGSRPGIEASRIINATQSVLAPINNSLQSQHMRQ